MDTYEKKYKKALERAEEIIRYYHEHNRGDEAAIEDFREVFPELKESEDEKIRKWLLNFVQGLPDEGLDFKFYNLNKEQVIAWLEKQGEQRPIKASYTTIVETGNGGVNTCVTRELSNGEQEPADKIEPRFKVKYAGSEYNVLEVKDIAGVTFYGIEDEPNHIDYVQAENCERVDGYSIKENGSSYPTKPAMFSEQNPAWSEGDSFRTETLMSVIKSGGSIRPELRDEFVNWLKSLKNRVQPQPKQEWSEEDEEMANDLIKGCLSSGRAYYIAHTSEEIADWLKSLKDRVKGKEE